MAIDGDSSYLILFCLWPVLWGLLSFWFVGPQPAPPQPALPERLPGEPWDRESAKSAGVIYHWSGVPRTWAIRLALLDPAPSGPTHSIRLAEVRQAAQVACCLARYCHSPGQEAAPCWLSVL